MSVMMVDKRLKKDRISGVEMSNGFWFKCLDVEGMAELINTQHSNDEINATPSKAKRIAELLLKSESKIVERDGQKMVFDYLIDFLKKCNGFRTY